jgi:hypothetical protein
MRQKLAFILIVLALAGCRAIRRADVPPLSDVRAALAKRYPASNIILEGQLQFGQDTPIERIDLPALAKALPNVHFFTTELRTGYYEYPEVSVAVAVPKEGLIAVYLSPTYSESDLAFITLLTRAQVPRVAEEYPVAQEIARLFAMITYKGAIRDQRYETGRFSAELWHGGMFWRRVSVAFENGRVSSVTITNQKDGRR